MADQESKAGGTISRDRLAELLNEDLAREYQAIIAYVVYSQVLKGAEYMSIAQQLELHAKQELDHALTLSRQIDYLGKMPTVTPKPVKTSDKAKEMLRFDLDNENETISNYRERIRQCEALGEFAMAEQIRQILVAGAGSPDRSGDRARRGRPRHERRLTAAPADSLARDAFICACSCRRTGVHFAGTCASPSYSSAFRRPRPTPSRHRRP